MRTALLIFALTATAAPAQSGPHPILRIDQATAVIDGNRMIVSAKGAVATGGWENPRLIEKKSKHEPGDVVLEFVATPPENAAAVVQSVVPVSVSVRTRLPRAGVAAVRVISKTNSVTAQIIPKKDSITTPRK